MTEEFFCRVSLSDLCTSEVARMEVSPTPDATQREAMLNLLNSIEEFKLTQEMIDLAQDNVHAGIFPELSIRDAQHVAAASIAGIGILVSWNFKHLVNRRRRAAVLEVNTRLGLPAVEIIAPSEY
ncbi:hypothetical protein BH09SUM1_BH09SUM1_04560 [soil metagenome]